MSHASCHAALNIPELLHLIFRHLLSFKSKDYVSWLVVSRSARADLYSAALVSRAFAEAALDVFWSRLDYMRMLKPLLGIQCEEKRHTTCEPLHGAIHAERLRGYLGRVREVIVDLDAEEPCTLGHLFSAIPSGAVLPNLTKVSVILRRSILLGKRAGSVDIVRLICPSVVEFRFISSHNVHSVKETSAAIGEQVDCILSRALEDRIGDLQTLEVNGGGQRVGLASDPEALLPARNLRRLVLSALDGTTIASSATQQLLSLPRLQHFHLDNYRSSRRPFGLSIDLAAHASSQGLAHLAFMSLICPITSICSVLQTLHVVQSVQELCFGHRPSDWHHASDTGDKLSPSGWAKQWMVIGASVSGRFAASLRAIKLQGDAKAIGTGRFAVFLKAFRGLSLTSFDYTAPCDLHKNMPRLVDVAAIAAQWPSLQHLGLVMSSPTYTGVPDPALEQHSLALGTPEDIARPFAHLRSLRCGTFTGNPLHWTVPLAKSGIQEVDVACGFESLPSVRQLGGDQTPVRMLPTAIGYLVRCFPDLERVTMRREDAPRMSGSVDAMKRINRALDDVSKQSPGFERCSSFTTGDVVIYRGIVDYEACLMVDNAAYVDGLVRPGDICGRVLSTGKLHSFDPSRIHRVLSTLRDNAFIRMWHEEITNSDNTRRLQEWDSLIHKTFFRRKTPSLTEQDMHDLNGLFRSIEEWDMTAKQLRFTHLDDEMAYLAKLEPPPPGDQKYNFRKRAAALVGIWSTVKQRRAT